MATKGVQLGARVFTLLRHMYPPVVTRNPAAVAVEVQALYRDICPDGDSGFVARIFGWAEDCFSGRFADYQAVDVPYHDFEHTLQGTLCMGRLLHGRERSRVLPRLERRLIELGLLAILLHDTGYLKRRSDTEGTGAKYTLTHVHRSAEFATEFLGAKGFAPEDIHSVRNMIQCTGLDAELESIPFATESERIVGHALGTADLLGQMAADDYVDKLPALFDEFAEAARHVKGKEHFVASYASAEALMKETPEFWRGFVQKKLEQDFHGLYRFLNRPLPDGPNWYFERVEANMERLRDRKSQMAGERRAAPDA